VASSYGAKSCWRNFAKPFNGYLNEELSGSGGGNVENPINTVDK